MGIKLITNGVWEDAVQLAASDVSTTTHAATDGYNVTGGGRHLRSVADSASKALIYRNNDKRLHADCCVLGGISRAVGHNVRLRHYTDCQGAWDNGSSQDFHTWADDDFALAYGRDFDGSSQYASIAHADQTGLTFTGNFWLATWFVIDTKTAVDMILEKYVSSGSQRGYQLHWNDSASALRFFCSSDGLATVAVATSSATITTGQLHFAFVYHQNGTEIGISVDGGAFNTTAHTAGIFATTAPFNMMKNTDLGAYTDGLTSRACCGTDLTIGPAAMSSWLHQGGAGRNWQEWTPAIKENFGLVSHWSCDENSGDILDDHGTNHLTPNNGVTVATANINYKSISDRFNQGVDNPNDGDAAQFNSTEICGPKDKTGKPQDLVYFFPSRSAQFVAANFNYLNRTAGNLTGLNAGNESFTVGFHYRQLGASGSNAHGMVCMGTGGTTDRRFSVFYQAGVLYFQFWDTSGASKYCDFAISLETDYYVIVTYDSATNTGSLYVDDVFIESQVSGTNLNTCVTDFRVGFHPGSKFGWCNLRNLFVINSILSAEEMAFLYNDGAGRDFDQLLKYDGLQAKIGACSWWPLNENGGDRGDRGEWRNQLTDNYSTPYADAPTTRDGGGLLPSKEGFGIHTSSGNGGAYTEKLAKFYVGESLDLGTAQWPVNERPATGKISVEGRTFEIERSTSLTFENLTRDEIAAFEARDLNEPVFIYDKNAKFLHDKLWHCIIDSYNITPQFDDLNTLTISMQRLKHYEVD